jgi:mono/diheme cytochrome c family protein
VKKIVLGTMGLLALISAFVLGALAAEGALSRISLVLSFLLWTVLFLYALARDNTLNSVSLLLLLASYAVCKAIRPPLPASLVALYVGFMLIGLAVFVSIENRHMQSFTSLWTSFLASDGARVLRVLAGVLVLAWVGLAAYSWSMPKVEPPVALRVIHPAPPSSIKVHGKQYDLARAQNPFRKKDADQFAQWVDEGKALYYQNCFYCHGDTLDGKGHFANAFTPFPANFVDVGTIAMLQESYVFWRVAKGGPGLPKESTPWSSAMPRWEDMMTPEEMWKVVLYIYEGTGHSPRTWEEAHIPREE